MIEVELARLPLAPCCLSRGTAGFQHDFTVGEEGGGGDFIEV